MAPQQPRVRRIGKRVQPTREVYDRAVAEFFMRVALEEAAKGLGRTSPNPVVGAVIVKTGKILARGHHRKAGTAHAEIVALEAAGSKARGADLYTTLEPCDHYGRTGPCSQAIIEAGIRRVFVGSADPFPLVNGKGIARLRAAGVEVLEGVLREEADRLNQPFFHVVRTGLPYVTLKAAITLDGKIATATGDSRWVTGEKAREWVHGLRNRVDAILVGANTVQLDDPQLTTRLPDGGGRDPVRIVVDSSLRLSPRHRVFTQQSEARTIVATLAELTSPKAKRLAALGVELWKIRSRKVEGAPRVDLRALLQRIAKEGLNHVLCEGGAQLYGTLLREDLARELLLFIAPKLIGGSGLSWSGNLAVREMRQALAVTNVELQHVGEDLLLRAEPAIRLRKERRPPVVRLS